MANLLGYSRNTIYGHLPGGEVFNFSLWADGSPTTQADTQAQAAAFATEFKADPGVNLPAWKLVGPDTGFDGCRTYAYTDTTGKATYIGDATIAQVGSSSATALLPNQCALVVSLKTSLAGRRHQGRVYLPFNKFALGSQGQLDTPTALSIASWFADVLHRMNTHLISPGKVGVLSRWILEHGDRTQALTKVTTCVVDTRIDVQRRRAGHEGINGRGIAPVT